MNFKKVSSKAVILWEVLAAVLAGLLLALVLYLFSAGTWLWYLLLWVLGAAWVLAAFLYIPLYYLSMEYGVSEDAVVLRKGVIFPSTQVLFRDRIAFVTVYRNPLTPLLGISSLVVSAAGGSLHLLFLDSQRALELAAQLSHGGTIPEAPRREQAEGPA